MVMALPSFAQDPEAQEIPEAQEAREAPEVPEATEAPASPEAPEVPEIKAAPKIGETPASTGYADTVNVIGRIEVIETPEQTRVSLGKNEVIIIEENGDTVVVALGSKGISIVEEDDGVQINVIDMEDRKKSCRKKKKNSFDAHWAGLEFGLNNYLTPDFSMVLPPDQEYMDLNTGKSWNWNLNFVDYGIGLGTNYVGLVSGLGFEFINYNFDGQNSIMKDPVTGEIVEYIPPYAGYITKSKMNIAYVTAPLLLEFQIPTGKRRIHISGGVIGGVKMWSNTKIKYTESGDKSKEKNKSDFNLSPLRWGVTARIGYADINLFANYYMTSLFKPDRGPELYPFTVGIALVP